MGELNLLEKTELWVVGVTLEGANLTDMAAAVAGELGLPPNKVMVVDVRDGYITFDLLEREIPHHILWAHPVSGAVSCCPVARRGDLTRCLFLLCAQPAPLSGRSILDCPIRLPGAAGAVRRLHVTADGEPL